MTSREENLASMIRLLGHIPSGKATVTVGGRPLLAFDADEKTLQVEADGVGEAGLHISDLVKLNEGKGGMVEGSMHLTGALARLGWKLTLYAGGDEVMSMGKGVSRLTGRVSVNPLRLRKLLKALK